MMEGGFWIFVIVMVVWISFGEEIKCQMGNETACAIIAIVDADKVAEATE